MGTLGFCHFSFQFCQGCSSSSTALSAMQELRKGARSLPTQGWECPGAGGLALFCSRALQVLLAPLHPPSLRFSLHASTWKRVSHTLVLLVECHGGAATSWHPVRSLSLQVLKSMAYWCHCWSCKIKFQPCFFFGLILFFIVIKNKTESE